jgi:hypothetical protein
MTRPRQTEGIGVIIPQPAIVRPMPPIQRTSGDAPTCCNGWIADSLRLAASVLAVQGAHAARGTAYCHAADAIMALGSELRDTVDAEGHAALVAMPGIGHSLAGPVAELLATGRWGFLERLRGASDPEALFCAVPGIGPSLAHKLQETLRLESLEALEAAARDGGLQRMAGFGPRRAAMVLTALAAMPARVRPPMPDPANEPEIALLLDVDAEYREQSADGELFTIPPRHFDRDVGTWLPVLHTTRGTWHLTALWSYTPGANRYGRCDDPVAVYFHCEGRPEGRRTIAGVAHRIVRGREAECASLDASKPVSSLLRSSHLAVDATDQHAMSSQRSALRI